MSNKNILIAEDEAIVSLDLKMLLKNKGFNISSNVSTGEELIDQYRLKRPDLIIADLLLKGKVSGLDAINEIRKIDSTPIIIISGSLKSKLKKIVNSIPYCEALPKPFDQPDLLFLINKFLKSN
ncbi:MAG: response regulator [Ignavibacteriaceae bacterium]